MKILGRMKNLVLACYDMLQLRGGGAGAMVSRGSYNGTRYSVIFMSAGICILYWKLRWYGLALGRQVRSELAISAGKKQSSPQKERTRVHLLHSSSSNIPSIGCNTDYDHSLSLKIWSTGPSSVSASRVELLKRLVETT